MSIRAEVITQFKQVAKEQDKRLAPLDDRLPLLDSGLDSLCFAVIVARLEDALGIDPFSAAAAEDAPFPVTLGDFVSFYENAAK
jgi:acyl carrier protein